MIWPIMTALVDFQYIPGESLCEELMAANSNHQPRRRVGKLSSFTVCGKLTKIVRSLGYKMYYLEDNWVMIRDYHVTSTNT